MNQCGDRAYALQVLGQRGNRRGDEEPAGIDEGLRHGARACLETLRVLPIGELRQEARAVYELWSAKPDKVQF